MANQPMKSTVDIIYWNVLANIEIADHNKSPYFSLLYRQMLLKKVLKNRSFWIYQKKVT